MTSNRISSVVAFVLIWAAGLIAAQPTRYGYACALGGFTVAAWLAHRLARPWLWVAYVAATLGVIGGGARTPPTFAVGPHTFAIGWVEPAGEDCELESRDVLIVGPAALCDRVLPGDELELEWRGSRDLDDEVERGDPSPSERLGWHGAMARLRVLDTREVLAQRSDVHWHPLRAIARLRRTLRRHFVATFDERDAGMLRALVLGERSTVSPVEEGHFVRLGALHVLSVSGLHLALVVGALAFIVRRILRRGTSLLVRRPIDAYVGVVVAPLAIAYALLTGAAPPTMRALAAVLIGAAAPWLGRGLHAPSLLAIAAWLLVVGDGSRLNDISLQLTIAATAGLIWGATRHRARLVLQRRPILDWLRAAMWLSIGSFVFTAPLLAWHFGELAWTAPLGNLLAVPLFELAVLPLGLLDGLLAATGLPTTWLDAVLNAVTIFSRCYVEQLATWAPLPADASTVWTLVMSGSVLALVRTRFAIVPLIVSLAVLLVPSPPHLRATWLSVGHGDAALVELADGRRYLIDGGGTLDDRLDPGRRIVLPYLRRRGIAHLDALILSHPHPDHANGLVAIAAQLDVAAIVTSDEESSLPALRELATIARARHINARDPAWLATQPSFVVLHPLRYDGSIGTDHARSENDNSLVVAVRHGRGQILFTGDIEKGAEAELVDAGRALVSTVLKVPHHGSRTSSSAEFLAAVAPRLAVLSGGRNNRWHLPNVEVLERYAAAHIPLVRTDHQGSLRVRVFADGDVDVRRVR